MPKYAKHRTTRRATPVKRRTYSAPKYTKKTYRKKTSTTYRRKSLASGRYAQSMQDNTFMYTKKKYTEVIPLKVAAGEVNSFATISIMGGRNSTSPLGTFTLAGVNPDGMLANDMNQHQHFKITGVALKLFFPEGTDVDHTAVQWSMAYSGSQVINPGVHFGPIQALSTFQTSGCDSSKPIKRYFTPNKQLTRLGVDWAACSEIDKFAAIPPVPLYGEQLPVNSGSSCWVKVTRALSALRDGQIGRVQVTYYVTYRGVKGNSDIV